MHKYQRHILEVIALLIIAIALYMTSLYSYLLFHSFAELFSIIIGFTLFIVAWNSRDFSKQQFDYLIFIGIAYMFVSFLDLLHTLSYNGMHIFKGYDFYANQLWIGARYLESISLLIPFIFMSFKKHLKPYRAFATYTIITSGIVASIFYFQVFPICFIAHQGQTRFKIISEYIICVILIADATLLRKNKNKFDGEVYKYLFWSIIFTIVSEFEFTLYLSNYGFPNLLGHYFKIISFYLIYKAVIITCITRPYQTIFRQLTDKENELTKIAMIDEMTELYNRRAGMDILDKMMKKTSQNGDNLTICFIDVDNLKKINDTYGHIEGDNLILTVAKLLSCNVRESDYVCRVGGDEFLIIFPHTTINQAKLIINRIRSNMENYNASSSHNYKVDFSYGFAEYNNLKKVNIDLLIEIADNNMYQNKMQKRRSPV
ncbi:MASE3 domain-containing protein [Clostridium sp. WILCCON 0269]|uniref:MASE3 domain-containing protein n=1 Tax=Candidatus Clostridium eludens TaxID=3381663 RepID=A0ABW8SUX9_9CLOT